MKKKLPLYIFTAFAALTLCACGADKSSLTLVGDNSTAAQESNGGPVPENPVQENPGQEKPGGPAPENPAAPSETEKPADNETAASGGSRAEFYILEEELENWNSGEFIENDYNSLRVQYRKDGGIDFELGPNDVWASYSSEADMGTMTAVLYFEFVGDEGVGISSGYASFVIEGDTVKVTWEEGGTGTYVKPQGAPGGAGGNGTGTPGGNGGNGGSGASTDLAGIDGGIYEYKMDDGDVKRIAVYVDKNGGITLQFDDNIKYAYYESAAEMGTFIPSMYSMSDEIAGEAAYVITKETLSLINKDYEITVYNRVN